MSSPTTPQPSVRKKATTRKKKVQPKPMGFIGRCTVMLVLVLAVLIPLWIIYAIFSWVATPSSSSNQPRSSASIEVTMHRLGRNEVLAVLKDPSSATFRNQKKLCGEVNSKNSFGAYTGFQRFIAVKDFALLEHDSSSIEHTELFNQLWAASCR